MRHPLPVIVLLAVAAGSSTYAVTLPIITKCPPDAVLVGQVCVDKFEASVWSIPNPTTTNKGLVTKVMKGKATLADLTGGGATEISLAGNTGSCSPGFPSTFPVDGQWTAPLYAVSIPGVIPTGCVTWLQAEQACRLSGKRLLTNQEWQAAATGTPDPGATPGANDCNLNSSGPSNTGAQSNCKSAWGVFDMVGNVWEWVADWVPLSTACPGWGGFSDDEQCFAGASTTGGPGALIRGGSWVDSTPAGVFAISGMITPSLSTAIPPGQPYGFRCAR